MVQRSSKLIMISLTLAGGIFFTSAYGQRLASHSRPRLNGEITYLEAANRAQDFIDLLNLPRQASADLVVQIALNFRTESERYWRVQGPKYTVSVLSRTGRIASFFHYERQAEQYRGRGRTGIRYVRTQAEAREKLMALATRLGIIPSCQIGTVTVKFDGQVKDKNSAGYFGATFLRNGTVAATISCDIQDGVPTGILLPDEYRD